VPVAGASLREFDPALDDTAVGACGQRPPAHVHAPSSAARDTSGNITSEARAATATVITTAAPMGGRDIAPARAFGGIASSRAGTISGTAILRSASVVGESSGRERGDTKTRIEGAMRVIGVSGDMPVGKTSTSRASVHPDASDMARSRSRNRALVVLSKPACGSTCGASRS